MTDPTYSRRHLIELGLALPAGIALAGHADIFGTPALAATPQLVDADDDPTPALTEGPYFTPSSPKRRSIVPAGATGTRLTLTGRVLTTSGKPVKNALIDVWQADARGAYDNSGYRFRGHQLTDAQGRYTLLSVVPGLYPGRTKHIHVKVQAPRKPALTTQLFRQPQRQHLHLRVPDQELEARERTPARTLRLRPGRLTAVARGASGSRKGAERTRTAVRGFAGLCLTTRPRRRRAIVAGRNRIPARAVVPATTETRRPECTSEAVYSPSSSSSCCWSGCSKTTFP